MYLCVHVCVCVCRASVAKTMDGCISCSPFTYFLFFLSFCSQIALFQRNCAMKNMRKTIFYTGTHAYMYIHIDIHTYMYACTPHIHTVHMYISDNYYLSHKVL